MLNVQGWCNKEASQALGSVILIILKYNSKIPFIY